MRFDARDLARVRNSVLLVSAAAWILMLLAPAGMAHCPAMGSGAAAESLEMLLTMNPPARLAAGWALMLAAMMAPALIAPLLYIRWRSFTHRRARSSALFLAGYAALWMAVGGVLLASVLAVEWLARPWYLPAAGAILLAMVWQFSPAKQLCLNRCHAHTCLAAFGAAADWAALRFGVTHGVWCAGSCWAWMLFPMLLPTGNVPAMAAVTVLIFSERLEQPKPPCWRCRGFGQLIRMVTAQARIRWQTLPSNAQA